MVGILAAHNATPDLYAPPGCCFVCWGYQFSSEWSLFEGLSLTWWIRVYKSGLTLGTGTLGDFFRPLVDHIFNCHFSGLWPKTTLFRHTHTHHTYPWFFVCSESNCPWWNKTNCWGPIQSPCFAQRNDGNSYGVQIIKSLVMDWWLLRDCNLP